MKPAAKRVVFWGSAALGVTLIVFLLLRYDAEAVFVPLLHSKVRLLLAVVLLQATIQVLNAVTPVVLLGPPEVGGLSRWGQTRVFLAIQPLALLAPARLTDFGAMPLLKRYHRPGAVASSIVLDRLITLFFLLLMAPLALRMVWPGSTSTANSIAIAIGLLLVAATPFALASRNVRSLANRYLLRMWPSLLRGFGAHTDFLLHASRFRMLVNLALTAFKTLLSATAIALLAKNVGISLSMLTAFWMSVLIQLATSLPISPQGLGVAEGSLVFLFEANDLSGALALSVGVMGRLLFIPVIGLIYFAVTLPLIAERLQVSSRSTVTDREAVGRTLGKE